MLAAAAAPAAPLQAPAPRHLIREVDGESEASRWAGCHLRLLGGCCGRISACPC